MKPILLTAAGNPESQDRGVVIHDGPRLVLCVADGAGGRSGGTEAANMTVEWVRQNANMLKNAESCAEMLRKLDAAIANDAIAGETTCALAVVISEDIFGASVGDSGIWLIPATGNHLDLTQGQQRKPFIGSGNAWPVSFQRPRQTVTLFHATKLHRVGAGGGVAHENIIVHEVPVNEIHDWLEDKAKAGALIDPKVYAGLYFIGRRQ